MNPALLAFALLLANLTAWAALYRTAMALFQ